MKVLLLNPAFNRYGGLKGYAAMVPLNLCYLAAYVRHRHLDVTVRILDAEMQNLTYTETIEEVKAFSPTLIGITSTTAAFDSVIQLTSKLKSALPKSFIVIGGAHISALPENSLQESGADFAVIGEGELTFEELVSHIKQGNDNWDTIHGLVYLNEDGGAIINAPRKLIEDLDMLPFPARDLIDHKFYIPQPTKRISLDLYTLLATSRGCPFRCGFCSVRTIWTRRVRFRKQARVIAEIEECVSKYGIRTFRFIDDLFTANRNRVLELCQMICDRKLDIIWIASSRAQRLDKEMLEAMKEAGCREISFGIESGNREVLKKIDKGLDLDEALKVVRLTKKVGISTHASYIMGYIGETEQTMQDTIRFAQKANTHYAAFFIATPLPGTPFYDEALQNGYLRAETTWVNYAPLSNADPVLELPNLSSATLRKWHRKALRSYYFRLRYILFRLFAIRHLYEIVNLFNGLKLFFHIKK